MTEPANPEIACENHVLASLQHLLVPAIFDETDLLDQVLERILDVLHANHALHFLPDRRLVRLRFIRRRFEYLEVLRHHDDIPVDGRRTEFLLSLSQAHSSAGDSCVDQVDRQAGIVLLDFTTVFVLDVLCQPILQTVLELERAVRPGSTLADLRQLSRRVIGQVNLFGETALQPGVGALGAARKGTVLATQAVEHTRHRRCLSHESSGTHMA